MTGPESPLERSLRALFTNAGGTVYSYSQGYRPERGGTRQTAGPTDLEVFFPAIQKVLKFEVKTPDGLKEYVRFAGMSLDEVRRLYDAAQRKRPSPVRMIESSLYKKWKRAHGQRLYMANCLACDLPYGMGGFPEAAACLVELGLGEMTPKGYFMLRPKHHPLVLRSGERVP